MLAQRPQQAVRCALDRLCQTAPGTPALQALAALGCVGEPLSRVPADATVGTLPAVAHCAHTNAGGATLPLPPDLLLVLAGARPMALLHGPETQVQGWLSWATRRRLAGLTSALEFQPRRDRSLGHYANLMVQRRPSRMGSGAWRGVFISPDPTWVVTAWLAELRGWDAALGASLGYPACCIDAFSHRWPTAVRHFNGDPGLMLLAETAPDVPIPWELNLFARYQGPAFTEHFPCSWHCQPSIRRARQLSQVLALIEPAAEADIRQRMQQPLVIAGRHLAVAGSAPQYPPTELSS